MSDEIARRRAEIAEQDRAILDAMNARLRLVAELKTYKERAGIDFVDADQEERLLRELANANRGPLSARGLQQLFREILALTKRELPDT